MAFPYKRGCGTVAKRPSHGRRATNQCFHRYQCGTQEDFCAQCSSSHCSSEIENDIPPRVLQSSPACSRGLRVTEEHYVSDGIVAPIPSPTASVRTWSSTPPEYSSFAASSEGHLRSEAPIAEDVTQPPRSSMFSMEESFPVQFLLPYNSDLILREGSPVPPPPSSPAQREEAVVYQTTFKPPSSDISTNSLLTDSVDWNSSISTDCQVQANSQQAGIEESVSDTAHSEIAPDVSISEGERQDEPPWKTSLALVCQDTFARCCKDPSAFFPTWLIFIVMTLVFAIGVWGALQKGLYGK